MNGGNCEGVGAILLPNLARFVRLPQGNAGSLALGSQEWDIMKTVMRTANFASFNGRAELHGFPRIYVEKRPGFDVEARQLAGELRTILRYRRAFPRTLDQSLRR